MTESKPSVKLTRREPTAAACDAGVDKISYNTRAEISNLGQSIDVEIDDEAPGECWQVMHDAAPSEPTEALRQHLRTVRAVLNGDASLNDLGGSYDAFVATPEGRALLQEGDDGSVS